MDPLALIVDSIKDLRQEVKDLDIKVDKLLEWRARQIGASLVVSAILTIIFQVGLEFIKK